MIPAAFAYHSPTSVDDALRLLAEHGLESKVLAGGQSLIPMMRFRLAEPGMLIDVGHIDGLAGIEESGGWLRMGAMACHADVESSGLIGARYPLLAEAAAVIADPLVRNRGTLGGSLAHADPAGDWGAVMVACRAELVARSARGERVIPIDDFFLTTFTSVLEPDELLLEVRVPAAGPGSGGAYEKLERKVGDFATVAVAVQMRLGADGACTEAGIGLAAVGPTTLRAAGAEAELMGGVPGEAEIRAASERAAEESAPVADNRGSAEYKRDMVRVLTARALCRAFARAREEA